MHMLDFLDYKTLLACECVLAIVFTVVFAGLNRIFPRARGAHAISLSFGLVVPETIFMAMGGHVSPVISVLMANTLTLSSLIAMYEGIVQFVGGPSRRWQLWFIAFTSFAVVYLNTEVNTNLAPCIISVSLVMAVIRGFTAMALLQRSGRSTQRKMLRFFGLFIAAMGVISLRLAWTTWVHGLPTGTTEVSAEQALMRATGMIYMTTSGLCMLLLTSRELAMRRRLEVHRDSLTGAFNRGGLDLNLAIEMERSGRTGLAFSVALIEIDHLGRISEAEGRGGVNATLREVAETTTGQLRGTDHIGRYEGDLFLLLLSQTTHDEALIVTQRVAMEVGRLKLLTTAEPITLSIGITESVADDTEERLIARAGKALQQAQSDGGNCRRVVLGAQSDPGSAPDSQVSAVA